ncbi:MAG: hypothetical protein IJK73_06955 [Bacteroidales bacterium]|nr:hypothetical protein [Bacteroidales bacterium]
MSEEIMERVKISELPSVSTYVNLFTIGTDGLLRSVKVPLDILGKIGNINDLQTVDKSSLVAAINEAAQTGGGGGTTLTGFVVVDSIAELPDPGVPTLGYLVGEDLYLYVGTGGDTLSGKYKNAGKFRGPEGRHGQGITDAEVSVDNGQGTPSADAVLDGGRLLLSFHNLKGKDGKDGAPGEIGPPGVTSVAVSVDGTSGTPSAVVTLVEGLLTIIFSGLKGLQGNPGSNQDYPFTLANNLITDDASVALSAAQGVVLKALIDALTNRVVYLTETEFEALTVLDPTKIYCTYEDNEI